MTEALIIDAVRRRAASANPARNELERRDLHRGLITMCAGGRMAPALIVERV